MLGNGYEACSLHEHDVIDDPMANIWDMKDIAPTYYDISTFKQGDVKSALMRTGEKIRRREALKGGRTSNTKDNNKKAWGSGQFKGYW